MNYFKGKALFKSKILRNGLTKIFNISGAKAGATAGWTVNNGANSAYANLPASQTASTLIVPLPELNPGDVITGFAVNGGLTSAGGAVTLDAALHKQVPASGAVPTDSSVGAITQLSATASAVVSSSKTGLSETVVEGVGYYLLLTGTTAASTAVNITSLSLYINQAS